MASSLLPLPFTLERKTPPFEGDDIRFPESLPRHFISHYTKTGQKIFDPFAGLGTTLFVAEELGRIPYGIEADLERYEWAAGQLEHWLHLINADALHAPKLGFPKMDMLITSPPFMRINDTWNPLAGKDGDYAAYLRKMTRIFANFKPILKKNAPLIIQLDNINGHPYTPLIRDVGACIAKSFTQTDEIIVNYCPAKNNYPHTHCLVFKA